MLEKEDDGWKKEFSWLVVEDVDEKKTRFC